MASLPELSDITANADKPVALSRDLKNFDNLTYEITDSASTLVKKGSLSPDNITIDANNIASGEYTVTVSIPDGSGSTSFRLRLYRFSDAMPASSTKTPTSSAPPTVRSLSIGETAGRIGSSM